MAPTPTQKPTYFLAPTRTSPPDGPIKLGNVLALPTLPEEPINESPLPEPDPGSISEHNTYGWTGSASKTSTTKFGIWTSFLQMFLSVGADVSVSWKNRIDENWRAERMTTISFQPSKGFIERAIEHEDVKEHLKGDPRDPIFMITGVMVAREARGVSEYLAERGLHVHAGVDLTAWTGVPVSLGPDVEVKGRQKRAVGVEAADDFVFAYRIRKIRVRRREGVTHKAYTKGALFDLRGQGKGDEEEEEFEIEGMDEEAGLEDDEYGFEVEDVVQVFNEHEVNGEECVCVRPTDLD